MSECVVARSRKLVAAVACAAIFTFLGPPSHAIPFIRPIQQPAPGAVSRPVGTIKGINGMVITLTPDSGAEVKITVQPSTRILRMPPGGKDLKNATPIQFQDLQVGDRVLIGGTIADDGSVTASTVVAMKRADLDARHQQEMQDWRKRGVEGMVSAVDPAAGTVTISLVSFTGKKELVIHTPPGTEILRYAANSVKFADAKPSSLAEIHPGDQARARGDRSADGTELKADEIVYGRFPNIAGVITGLDASASTLTVQDLLSKKPVTVKVTSDSQLRHIPAETAQRIAARLKGAAPAGAAAPGAPAQGSGRALTTPETARPPTSDANGGGGGAPQTGGMGGRSGGPPDFQQMLSRMPAASIADLHKGDAVIIVATEDKGGLGMAIILLSGVEPILQAAPNASQAMMLAPWSLSAPVGDAGGP